LFAHDERRAEVSAVATPGAGDLVPFGGEFEDAIEGQKDGVLFKTLWTARLNSLVAVRWTFELLLAGGVAK
jgi:hypothetical protein